MPALTVTNMYFDVRSKSEQRDLVLYDLSFNLLLENKAVSCLDFNAIRKEYKMMENRKSVIKQLMGVIKLESSLLVSKTASSTAERAHRSSICTITCPKRSKTSTKNTVSPTCES